MIPARQPRCRSMPMQPVAGSRSARRRRLRLELLKISARKAMDAVTTSSATTLDEARYLEANGAVQVITQLARPAASRPVPVERHQHAGRRRWRSTWQITKVVRVPVIAAGGIADAMGVTAAKVLGAAGAQIGTAYLLSQRRRPAPFTARR